MAGGVSNAIISSLHVVLIMVPMSLHFLLASFVLLSGWLPQTFIFSHILLILIGVWCCHDRASVYPVILYIVVLLMTILLDIIQLGLHFHSNQNASGGGNTQGQRTWQFSAGMMIMSLIFKPLTTLLAFLVLYIRHTGSVPTGGSRDSYSVIHGQDGQQSE